MPVIKQCATCGKEFSVPPSKADKVFTCSHACKVARSRVGCVCGFCGKQFWEYKSQIAAGAGKYCSKKCHSASMAKPPKVVKPKPGPVIKVCEVCGKEYRVPPTRANTARACSNECGYKLRAISRSRQVQVTCKNCGKEYSVPESHESRSKYCSIGCKNKDENYLRTLSERMAGRNNPMFCGATTEHISCNGRAYKRSQKHKENARGAKRRAWKLQATPAWANEKAMLRMYKEAQAMTIKTGVKHHVDHIVPLISNLVCGLHVECNLQILTQAENLSKGNRIKIS